MERNNDLVASYIRLIDDHIRVHGIGVYPHIRLKTALDLAKDSLVKEYVFNNFGFCKDCKYAKEYTYPESGTTVLQCRCDDGLKADSLNPYGYCNYFKVRCDEDEW